MPRKPIELTDEQRGEIETLAALLNQDQIADYLGIGRTTFHAIMERDPDVANAIKEARPRRSPMWPRGCCRRPAAATPSPRSSFSRPRPAGARPTGSNMREA